MSLEAVTLSPVQQRTELERILASSKERDPKELMRELWQFADTVGDDACEALLANNPELFEHKPTLSKVCFRWVYDFDIEELGRLPQGERRWSYRGNDLFQFVDFKNCKRMVSVGCGPYPSTALCICDKTDVPEIICLDVLPEAVETAGALFKQFGISRVRTEICSGEDFDYAGAGVVYVANMVSPKAAVLSRIVDTAPADVQIVVREPYALALLWTESGEDNLDPRLEITGRGRVGPRRSRDIYMRRRAKAL